MPQRCVFFLDSCLGSLKMAQPGKFGGSYEEFYDGSCLDFWGTKLPNYGS